MAGRAAPPRLFLVRLPLIRVSATAELRCDRTRVWPLAGPTSCTAPGIEHASRHDRTPVAGGTRPGGGAGRPGQGTGAQDRQSWENRPGRSGGDGGFVRGEDVMDRLLAGRGRSLGILRVTWLLGLVLALLVAGSGGALAASGTVVA